MPVDAITGASQNVSYGGVAEKDKLGQAEFMRLMIAQLRNQDPTKPMDPSQFLGQLAQFGTVSGIQDMQGSLSTLSDALRSTQVIGGTSLVGRDVLAAADELSLGETGSVSGSADMPADAIEATLVVTDSSGQLIRRLPLSAQEGEVDFTWDGTTDLGTRAPPGNYQIAAIANVGGAAVQTETRLVGRVGSVTIDPSTFRLTLNTNLGPVSLGNVRRVM